MKKRKRFFALFLCATLLVILSACTSPIISAPGPEPEPAERVMLDADCGWEVLPPSPYIEPPFSENHEGILVISDSLDDYKETHTFAGIRTPERQEDPVLFEGKAMKIGRYVKFGEPTFFVINHSLFVSIEEDYKYLSDTLNSLNFSKEPSKKFLEDYRLVIWTFDESLNIANEYLITVDGIVRKLEVIDGNEVYYESLDVIDYYQFSALEIKYRQWVNEIYWKFQEIDSESHYKLCISAPTGHRDFTLEEAKELFPSLLNVSDISQVKLVSQINHTPPYPLDSYLKITEYYAPYSDDSSIVEEQMFYLSPGGKLMKDLRTVFAASYENGDWERFECTHMWESQEAFNFKVFQKLLAE